MKAYFRLLAVILLLGGTFAPTFAATKGEKVFGVHTGYVSRNRSADVGLFFQYSFSQMFRLQPSADIIFRHNDRDAYIIDLNAQVPINIGEEDVCSLYPYAGLNFSSWNRHNYLHNGDLVNPGFDEVSSRNNYFGVNVGAGFDLKVSSTLKVSIEAGYTFVKRNSGVRVLAGIGYIF